jgi:hypothetical protein
MRILGWFKMIFRQNKPLRRGCLSLEYFDEQEITKEKFAISRRQDEAIRLRLRKPVNRAFET